MARRWPTLAGDRNRHRSRLAGGAFGALGLVALLLLPGISASSVVRYTAPYTGAIGIGSNTTTLVGCYHVTSVHTASPSTGRVAVWSQVWTNATTACAGHAKETSTAAFLGPTFTVLATGTYKVVYVWNVSLSAGVLNGSCVYVRYQRWLFGNLLDLTSGSWTLGGTTPTNLVVGFPPTGGCPYGTMSAPHKYVQFGANLTAGHTYEFYTGATVIARQGLGAGPCTGTPPVCQQRAEYMALNGTLLRMSLV